MFLLISCERSETSAWSFIRMSKIALSLMFLIRVASTAASAAVVVHDEWRVYGPSSNLGNSNWQDLSLPPTTVHRCVPVPQDMQLCHGFGYKIMRLPNMLHHETAAEAVTQISHWDMLQRANCHSDLPIFLCSMYAPICVAEFPDKEIRPCRSLCETIKRECYPVMKSYGYAWPEMANCTKFPGPEDPMCIRNQEKLNAVCKACKKTEDITVEFMGSNFCIYDLVFKANIKNVRQITSSNGAVDRVVEFGRLRLKAFLRSDGMGRLRSTALRKGRMRTEPNTKCNCIWLDGALDRKDKFLIMGKYNHATGEVDIKFIHKWERARGSVFRKGIRQIRKSLRGKITNICSNTIIPRKIEENKISMQSKKPRGGKEGRGRGKVGGNSKKNRNGKKNQKISSNKQQSGSSKNHRTLGMKTKTSVVEKKRQPNSSVKQSFAQFRRPDAKKKKISQREKEQKSNRYNNLEGNRAGNMKKWPNKSSDNTILTRSIQ